jgi:hypothetical protein
MKCILISHLKESKLSEDLAINDPEIIIDSLIEDHVVNNLIDLFSNRSDLIDTILVDILK